MNLLWWITGLNCPRPTHPNPHSLLRIDYKMNNTSTTSKRPINASSDGSDSGSMKYLPPLPKTAKCTSVTDVWHTVGSSNQYPPHLAIVRIKQKTKQPFAICQPSERAGFPLLSPAIEPPSTAPLSLPAVVSWAVWSGSTMRGDTDSSLQTRKTTSHKERTSFPQPPQPLYHQKGTGKKSSSL